MPFLKVKDLDLFYREQGAGQPVLLIHGNNSSSYWWEYTFERMKDAPYHLIAPDLRGRGDTRGPSAEWTVEQLADDVHQLMQALGIGRYHLVGHSLGASVALQLALDHKNDILSMALMNPGWVAGDIPAVLNDQARIDAMVANKEILKAALRGVAALHPEGEAWDLLLEASLKQADEASRRGPYVFTHWAVADRLPALAGIPTLVVRGAGDLYLSTEAVAMKTVNGIPGAKYEVIQAATHSPNVEAPDTWVALLKRHLEFAQG